MAPAGTLWTIPAQATGRIIRATAALAGVEIALPESYEHFVDNKKPEFLAKFSHGKIPAWEGADGFKLFEGAAIARYIASLGSNANLLGLTPEDAGLVDQWSHLVESELDHHTSLISYITSGILPYTKPTHTFSLERQARTLDTLENHLKTSTFFVGERITLADITVAGFVYRGVARTIDAPARAKIPNLIRHLETIVNQPKLKDIFGSIEYIEKGLEYKPPAKEKKEPKPAAAPTPKAEKKPKKEEAEDDDEPAVPAEPKVKNPLDDLPKSTFNLEDWKRAYSNKETRGAGGAIEWFYDNYDPEGFSIWRVDFKYNEELTQTFMSNNQIGGFFNRLEASRKYLFGSIGVLGTSGNSAIAGVFITRGPEIKATVDAAPDWESYAYKKLDVKGNEEDKKFFEAALAWDLELDGKAWTDGKNFK
ncbi:elongation factor 1-gamma [Crepidotus variabilis]|uniref:Elongation factor 1-gamma n=1 Tax=Crepidotus variabilis TaxID=179855 RepID=A0A9P6EJS0_9AGAR|nr:elongation factor 1-gamma [Crepidotus variabilis]